MTKILFLALLTVLILGAAPKDSTSQPSASLDFSRLKNASGEQLRKEEAAIDDWPDSSESVPPDRGVLIWPYNQASDAAFDTQGRMIYVGSSVIGRMFETYQYDSSFGATGFLYTGIASIRSVRSIGAGKYLASGRQTFSRHHATVLRLTSNGSYDTTFNTQGIFYYRAGNESTFARNAWENTNGSIVVGGYLYNRGNADLMLMRLSSWGNLDQSFGTGGLATLSVSSAQELPYAIVRMGNGYLFGGVSRLGTDKSTGLLVRANSAGGLDTSWATVGYQLPTFGATGDAWISDIELDTQGRVLIAANTIVSGVSSAVIARLHTNGTFDTSFATQGWFSHTGGTPPVGNMPGIALETAGSIAHFNGVRAFRISSDGRLETTFGTVLGGGGLRPPSRDLIVDTKGNYVGFGKYLTYIGDGAVLMSPINLASLDYEPVIGTFGIVNGTAGTQTLTYTVKNVGASTVSLAGATLSAPFSYTGGSYPGTGGGCGSSLAPSATCVLDFQVGPTNTGSIVGRVALQYGIGTAPATTLLESVATARVSAITHDAGSLSSLGSFLCASGDVSSDLVVTITNRTGQDISDLADSTAGGAGSSGLVKYVGGSYPGTDGTCGTSLTNGDSCTVRINHTAHTDAITETETYLIGSNSLADWAAFTVTGSTTNPDADADSATRCSGGVVYDCDDSSASVKPGLTENCTDGVDNNCDGSTDAQDLAICSDADADGSYSGADCNDNDNTMYPGNSEDLCDGKDNNCVGGTDEGRVDTDNDGYYVQCNDCDDTNAAVNPGAAENVCNGIDDDCDSSVDEGRTDADGDGYYAECNDCNDGAASINPGAAEDVCDGVDNDCDTSVDEGRTDADGDGYYQQCTDCNDSASGVNPGVGENVCNGIDDNCDSQTDEGRTDGDFDGYYLECNDCDDANGAVNPGQSETCGDAIDNNCNGNGDEC